MAEGEQDIKDCEEGDVVEEVSSDELLPDIGQELLGRAETRRRMARMAELRNVSPFDAVGQLKAYGESQRIGQKPRRKIYGARD